MKLPKNYIPGTNPYKSLPQKPVYEKKISKKEEILNQKLMKAQENVLKLYMRRLQKKDQLLLQEFLSNGHKVGSKVFNNLSKILKEVILKMNLESLKIMRENTKNPFTKLKIKISSWSLNNLLKALNVEPNSKKKK